jgi:(p)ppGpp synthase/HD superfamily hydrolase
MLRFDLQVRNRDHLAVVLRQLRSLADVKKITRL